MNEDDRVRFLKGMQEMKVSLPSRNHLTAKEEALRINVFWERLQRYDIEMVEAAIEDAIGIFRTFPAPSEILELVNQHLRSRNFEEKDQPLIEDKGEIPARKCVTREDLCLKRSDIGVVEVPLHFAENL